MLQTPNDLREYCAPETTQLQSDKRRQYFQRQKQFHSNDDAFSAKKSQMQVQVKKSFYQSFGGINFMEADITAIGFSNIVSQNVGHRSIQAEYSYADLLKT